MFERVVESFGIFSGRTRDNLKCQRGNGLTDLLHISLLTFTEDEQCLKEKAKFNLIKPA